MPFLTATTDITFKKLFADKNKKDITIAFLSAITGKNITNITHNESAAQPKIPWLKVSIEPIRCIDDQGISYIIDMHIADQPEYIERCQYYASLEIARQWSKTESYKKLSPVRYIGISQFPLFSDEQYSHSYNTQELALQEFYYIELNKFSKTAERSKNLLDQWIFVLKNSAQLEEIPAVFQENTAIVAAFEALRNTNYTKKELETYTELIETHKLETSRIQGARLEGEFEAARRIARKMFEQGMDAQTVSTITGLSVADCSSLQPQV